MESVDEAVRATGSRLVYLQAVIAKFSVLASCMVFSAVAVYPEAVLSSTASRTTEMPRVYTGSAETEEMVFGWVSRWQKRLAMQDWKIETRIVRLNQLPKGTVANIHWSLPRRTATIKVLDPIDSTLPRTEIVRDTELSVVHELVHLSMAKLPLDSSNTELEEETVKKLSSALLALDKASDESSAKSSVR
jgi:hypothetical protein